MSMRKEAKASHAAKRAAMGLTTAYPLVGSKEVSDKPLSNEEQAGLPVTARKRGGRVNEVGGGKSPKRLDRPGYGMSPKPPKLDMEGAPYSGMNSGGKVKRANGGRVGDAPKGKKGATTVNIVIAGQGAGQPQTPPPVPPVPAAPPPAGPPMPVPPPGGAPSMPGGMPMMRKRGGRVDPSLSMDAGAGGGEGRLEKAKKYGANAGKPIKGPA